MTAITSEQVMKLRNQTGAGIMDCKNALRESQGDVEKAVEFLRKKGLSGLAKRAGREMKEGLVVIKISDDCAKAAMLEINCETDFVARNPEFKKIAGEITGAMFDGFLAGNPAENQEAGARVQAFAVKTGENMKIRRGVVYSVSKPGESINLYLHTDSKKGALVHLSATTASADKSAENAAAEAADELKILAREIAMQCVAMNPRYIKRADVPAELIEKEKEIYKASPQAQGKGGIALEKMLEGRLNKFYQENCLLEQASIRDGKINVEQFIKNSEQKTGGKIEVRRFSCYIVGME